MWAVGTAMWQQKHAEVGAAADTCGPEPPKLSPHLSKDRRLTVLARIQPHFISIPSHSTRTVRTRDAHQPPECWTYGRSRAAYPGGFTYWRTAVRARAYRRTRVPPYALERAVRATCRVVVHLR